MNTEQRIGYSVALKEAGEFMRSELWSSYFDTDDIPGELFILTDMIYDGLAVKTDMTDIPKDKKSSRSGKKSTGGSKKRDSNHGGNTKPKDPDANASDAQLRAIKKMLKFNDYEYDRDGVDFNDEYYEWDELTMGEAQIFFDELGN